MFPEEWKFKDIPKLFLVKFGSIWLSFSEKKMNVKAYRQTDNGPKVMTKNQIAFGQVSSKAKSVNVNWHFMLEFVETGKTLWKKNCLPYSFKIVFIL